MRTIVLSLIFAVVVITTQAFVVRPQNQQNGRIPYPFPGQGTFNPRVQFPKPYRFRRSSQVDDTAVTATVVEPLDESEREPSRAFDYSDKVYEGEFGDISAKNPGFSAEEKVGMVGVHDSDSFGPQRPDFFPSFE